MLTEESIRQHNARTDEWTDGWMDGRTDGRTIAICNKLVISVCQSVCTVCAMPIADHRQQNKLICAPPTYAGHFWHFCMLASVICSLFVVHRTLEGKLKARRQVEGSFQPHVVTRVSTSFPEEVTLSNAIPLAMYCGGGAWRFPFLRLLQSQSLSVSRAVGHRSCQQVQVSGSTNSFHSIVIKVPSCISSFLPSSYLVSILLIFSYVHQFVFFFFFSCLSPPSLDVSYISFFVIYSVLSICVYYSSILCVLKAYECLDSFIYLSVPQQPASPLCPFSSLLCYQYLLAFHSNLLQCAALSLSLRSQGLHRKQTTALHHTLHCTVCIANSDRSIYPSQLSACSKQKVTNKVTAPLSCLSMGRSIHFHYLSLPYVILLFASHTNSI